MARPKIFDGTNWVECAIPSDIKTYYQHIIHVENRNNANSANFTLMTSDSSAYSVSTLMSKLQKLTNTWETNLPLNGFFWHDGAELEYPLLYVNKTGSGSSTSLEFRYLYGDGDPYSETIRILDLIVSDIVKPV